MVAQDRVVRWDGLPGWASRGSPARRHIMNKGVRGSSPCSESLGKPTGFENVQVKPLLGFAFTGLEKLIDQVKS